MDWQILVPVVAIAVFILSTLLRKSEEPPRSNRPRPIPGARPPGGRPPRPANDIDRFLEEIQRRRRQKAEEQAQNQPMEALPVEVERPSQPAAPPRVRRRPRPAGTPTAEEAVRRSPEERVPEAVAVVLVEEPRPVPPPEWTTPVKSFPQTEAPLPPAPPPPSPPAPTVIGEARIVPPAVTQLLGLLRTPQSLQTAVLLREVLGTPRCKRRARGI